MRTCLALLGLALVALPASAGEFLSSFPVGAGGRLVIALAFGSVDVQPHDGDTVRIEALSRGVGASAVHFAARAEGGDVFFQGEAEPWLRHLQSAPGVRVRAWVPPQTEVRVQGTSDVEVLRQFGGVLVLSP